MNKKEANPISAKQKHSVNVHRDRSSKRVYANFSICLLSDQIRSDKRLFWPRTDEQRTWRGNEKGFFSANRLQLRGQHWLNG